MQEYLVETDPEIRGQLIKERENLTTFLDSPGYKAAKRIVDESYNDAIAFILDADPTAEGYAPKIHQAIGEARTARDFVRMFIRRLEELNQGIGTLTDEEKP